ncbi:MAG: M91 family zinc metallopeptidase [Proteobacteria bacterium]|nr:M91 family zinc metallopeptidase [Pseudomonadota bacterium]
MNSDSKTETYAQGIQVKGSSQFRKDTKAALDRVNATPTGKLVIDDVVRSGKTVTIVETTDPNGFSKDFTEDANRKPDGTAGKGSSSTIAFNPSFKPDGLPNELILGHELIHAQNKAYGVRETGITGGTKDEELKTVGLPPYPESGMTENSLRKDLGLTKRTSY